MNVRDCTGINLMKRENEIVCFEFVAFQWQIVEIYQADRNNRVCSYVFSVIKVNGLSVTSLGQDHIRSPLRSIIFFK